MSIEARQRLVQAAFALHRGGMNIGTAGNLSERSGDGMLITPSGQAYTEMQAEDIVFVDCEGRAEGPGVPSSEWRMHLAVYGAHPDAGAVVHVHSTHATALACLTRGLPAFHYEVALAGGADVRCAQYATFGTPELAENVVRAMEGRRACLIANHGMVCHGPSLAGALALAQKVEHLAEIYLQCLIAGEPGLLDGAEMTRVAAKFRDYGKAG